ncbi:FAD-dependent oxidoreductase [Saccharospirillum alexandrii]|uniref:glycerol-3-phosphate dehydrogenase/oxidase n=1 Tax=Saccharospirillum alexandrii TaxID=2448477 RepID=UPI003735FBE9
MNEHSRVVLWQKLAARDSVSVIVIGAGINGISVFRELSLQGVDVILVDKADYCGGASAAPSRMIHGGLRYLESGETDLVRESLAERNALLRNAPHFVQPLPTTIPIFSWLTGVGSAISRVLGRAAKPSRRGALIIKLGLWLYDFYTRRQQVLPRHQFHNQIATHERWPELNKALVCSATYYDAWISYPERLGMEMVLDTVQQCPQALALNYVSVAGFEDGKVVLHDEASGEQCRIKPDIVINATGAWIDLTNEALTDPTDFIGGTKGSHLIVANERLREATGDHMIFYETPDGRVCILFPFMGNVLVGSTDLPVDSPEGNYCTPEEEAYILKSLEFVFPDIRIKPDEIVYRFSGIRPLPRSDADQTGQISRNHLCRLTPPTEQRSFPVYSMIGGKWTTFRAFGEQVANQVLARLGQPRTVSTGQMAIGGGRDYPADAVGINALLTRWSNHYQLPLPRITDLFERYGTRAEQVADYLAGGPDRPLSSQADYSEREIEFLIVQEAVLTLNDLVLRRTSLAIAGKLTGETLVELQTHLTRMRGLTPEQAQLMLAETQNYLTHFHGLTPRQLADPEHHKAQSA